MSARVQQAIDTIARLGLCPRPMLERELADWRARPPDDQTVDEGGELEGFLTHLVQRLLISSEQFQVLVGLLGAAPPPISLDGSLVGHSFGDYLAQAKIGEGAMAQVYRAKRVGGGNADFVIKVCIEDDEDAQERFRVESDLLSSLEHPHIVGFHEAGQQGDLHYMVLEYVDGPTLQELIDERSRFPWESATRATYQLASALAAAHRAGIVHRDVKPNNVLVARAGALKLCDFGVSKRVDADMTSRAGMILGSPAYIAPEQWGDHKVDHRVDLFALGVIYYQLLTGITPFHGKTAPEYALRIQSGQYVAVDVLVPDIPPGVRQVVDQMLENDRRYRTPSADALLADLDRLLQQKPPNVPRLEAVDDPLAQAFALVGKPAIRIGAGADVDLHIDLSDGAEHADATAHIERTHAGRLLRVEVKGQVEVNGEGIKREVVLKDGDQLRFGPEATFRYREGNLGRPDDDPLERSREVDPAAPAPRGPREPPIQAPVPVHGVLAAALEEAGHTLLILNCLEVFDPAIARATVEASRLTLQALKVPGHVAERVSRRASYLWQQRAVRLSERLFHTTHENLGLELGSWLPWWFEVRERYPLQLYARAPRAKARLLITPPAEKPTWVDLTERETWSLGRSREANITLEDLSISRRHARLYRLIRSYAFRDLGSRQGIKRDGQRQTVGLLQVGDAIHAGRVRLRLSALPQSARFDGSPSRLAVDRSTFAALIEARHPCVVEALVAMLDVDRQRQVCQASAAGAGITDAIGDAVEEHLQRQHTTAVEALTALGGADAIRNGPTWLANISDLPPQVEPFGWSE